MQHYVIAYLVFILVDLVLNGRMKHRDEYTDVALVLFIAWMIEKITGR